MKQGVPGLYSHLSSACEILKSEWWKCNPGPNQNARERRGRGGRKREGYAFHTREKTFSTLSVWLTSLSVLYFLFGHQVKQQFEKRLSFIDMQRNKASYKYASLFRSVNFGRIVACVELIDPPWPRTYVRERRKRLDSILHLFSEPSPNVH